MKPEVIVKAVAAKITSRGLRLGATVSAAALLAACAGTEPARTDSRVEQLLEPTLLASAAAAEAAYDYDSAANHYRNLLSRNPGNLDLTLSLARALRYAGQSDQAIALLGGMAGDKAPAAVLLELGKAHLAADHLNLAVRYLQAARDAAPQQWQIHSALGVAHDYKNNYAEAQQSYVEALGLSPNNPAVLNNLGLSQAQAGDLAGAAETLRKAVDQPGASPQVRQNLALVLALQGDAAGAERLARMDLPREMVRENMAYYRSLSGR